MTDSLRGGFPRAFRTLSGTPWNVCAGRDEALEIEEYDRLRSGAVSAFEATSLAELATLLVKARIARGWTQRRLADALGIAGQQVQRYESSDYRSASLARICDWLPPSTSSSPSARSCETPTLPDESFRPLASASAAAFAGRR